MTDKTATFVRRAVGTVAAGAFVTLCLPAPPASASIGSNWQRLSNHNSVKCLEVAGWSTANGGAVGQWDCHPGNNQLWWFWDKGGAGDLLYNGHSGKCLEVADWSRTNGAAVRQWDCHGGASQQWNWMGTTVDGTDYVVLQNVHSGKCLEIADWRTDDGAPARQWDCHYGGNQLFFAADAS